MSRDYVEELLRGALEAIDNEGSAHSLRQRAVVAIEQVAIRLAVKAGLRSFYAASDREVALWSSIEERLEIRSAAGGAGSIEKSLEAMSDAQVRAIVAELRELHASVARGE
jgi:hypothetical protein